MTFLNIVLFIHDDMIDDLKKKTKKRIKANTPDKSFYYGVYSIHNTCERLIRFA